MENKPLAIFFIFDYDKCSVWYVFLSTFLILCVLILKVPWHFTSFCVLYVIWKIMEAMKLKSMDLDKFGEFKHGDGVSKIKLWNFDGFGIALKEFLMKIWKKINFGRSLFLAVLTSEGYFGNYENPCIFWKKAISGKIVADFQSFKTI